MICFGQLHRLPAAELVSDGSDRTFGNLLLLLVLASNIVKKSVQ